MKVDREWPVVLSNLEVIRRLLVNRAAMLCNVTADAGDWAQFRPQLNRFLAELPTAPVTLSPWTPQFDRAFEGLTIPANVNYVGKGADLYQLGYRYQGSTSVITKYLRTTWLWEKVRMQGGAYGSFCSFDRQSGVLSFLSYRDPNLRGTLDVYDQAGRFLREADLSATEVTRAIIGAIGDLDAYRLPDAKGYSSMVRYLVGDTDEARQQMRDEILATQAGDFHAFADWLEQVREQGQVVVLGGQSAIETLNAEHPGQLKTVRVL
jgi:Zn-dependent M16 (insulinase) family peptidase